MMKKLSSLLKGLVMMAVFVGVMPHQARAQDAADPVVVVTIQKFMDALNIADFEASIKAAKPYMHKTLMSADGSDISPDLRRFGFKKAHENAGGYATPVNITRVRKTATSQVGFGATAEAGAVYDYFVGKKEGAGGMPAPLKVFIPSTGTAKDAKIYYIGSL